MMGRMERFVVGTPPFAAPPPPAAIIDLRGIVGVFRMRWRLIAASVLLVGALAFAVAMLIPPQYDATARVLLDPRNLQVLQNDLNPGSGSSEDSLLITESQAQIARSTDVLTRVVRAQNLAVDPDFGSPDPGLLSLLARRLTGRSASGDGPSETPEEKAVRALDRALAVRRSDKTLVVEIGVATSDADKSARIANAVANTFLDELARSRAASATRTTGALDGRLAELRDRLQRSEAAVERYRRSHDLIGAGGKLVGEQQLGDLANQLATARARTAETGARVAQVQRLRAGGDLPEGTTEAVQSTTLANLRATLAEALRVQGETALIYGPRHPANTGVAQRVQAARRQLDDELGRIAKAAAADYERARTSEAILDRRVASLKSDAASANAAQVQLRELEREASANRSVYEAFLNRARDLQERNSLDTSNARLIKAAVPPLTRSGTSKAVILAAGLILGLLVGLAAALMRDQFAAPPR
ncbi:MAG: GumC family protein [Methylobacterium frigidaeris]